MRMRLKRHRERLCGVLALLILLASAAACGKSAADRWQEQYDLGLRYLEEENYEEAVVAFTAAIEIDPKQADAYLDLADVYVLQGDYEAALTLLQNGLEQTGGDAGIESKIAEIQAAQQSVQETETEEVQAGGTPGEIIAAENISVSNFSYDFVTEGVVVENNEDAVGGIILHFTVEGPENVRQVLICSWSESGFDPEMIETSLSGAQEAWAALEVHGGTPPFEENPSFPVYAEDSGKSFDVLLAGRDEDGYIAGYTIASVTIPEL